MWTSYSMTRLRIATVSAAAAVVALTAVWARAAPSEGTAPGVSGSGSAVQARSASNALHAGALAHAPHRRSEGDRRKHLLLRHAGGDQGSAEGDCLGCREARRGCGGH